jgi:hypothetical protein
MVGVPVGWILTGRRILLEATQQPVNMLAQSEQVCGGGDHGRTCAPTIRGRNEISPINGNVRTAAVGQDECEMRPPFMSQPGEHLQHHTFEGMVRTGHADLAGDLSEVGSVLGVPSIAFPMGGC